MTDRTGAPAAGVLAGRRAFGAAFAMLAFTACASSGNRARGATAPSALPRTGQEDVVDRFADARFVLLGEVHDNPAVHHLRFTWLKQLSRGRRVAIAMEQFDRVKQGLLQAAQTALHARLLRDPALPTAALARELAEAGGFSFDGWQWPLYEPVVELALVRNLPIVAANLSDREASAVARGEHKAPASDYRPPQWTAADDAAMAQAIRDGHCGLLPEAAVAALARAQRARDVTMAEAMQQAAQADALPVVLLAGNGHVRTDIGVPSHLRNLAPDARIVAVAIAERGAIPPGTFDLVVADLEPVEREDPCESLRRRFAAHGAR